MIKTLYGSLRQYRKPSFLSMIFAIAEVICEVVIAFLLGVLVSIGVQDGNTPYIIKLGLMLVGISIIAILVGSYSGVKAAEASVGYSSNLRKDAFYKMQQFSFNNIDKFSSSSIITRLTTDVSNIQMSYFMILRMATRTIFMIIFAVIMAFNLHSQLAKIYIAIIPFLGIVLFFIIKGVYPLFSRVFAKYDNLNMVVQENLRGIRVVKSFVREEDERKKFGKISGDIYSDFTRAEKIVSLNIPVLMLTIYITIMLISWFGAKYIVVDQSMEIGGLISMITFTMQILINLLMLASVMVMIVISRNSSIRVAELLTETSTISDPKNPKLNIEDGSISFNNVSFSYSGDNKKLALMDINLSIKSGETIGIIGATGSSKTSLIQLIPRLYDATMGEVFVSGKNVKDYDLTALRDNVAVVLQKNVLFSGTVEENLRWGDKDATDEQLVEACKLAQAHDFIAELKDGYASVVEQGGSNFSGGQRQRLCIARALLKNPKILILDDSTSAVDTKTDSLIREAMRQFIPNTTKIIIAQRISSVEHADRIVIMANGYIEDIGSHSELITRNERYKGLYDSQLKGGGSLEE